MTGIDEFAAQFDEEAGYLDFARVGPVSRIVTAEAESQLAALQRARFGTLDTQRNQDARVRDAIAAHLGFRADQVVFQPGASQGLMHAMFGLTGTVAVARSEFPSSTYAATRAGARGDLQVRWLDADRGSLTPESLRRMLDDEVGAVVLSHVDFRTGYRFDLEAVREALGDRLLVLDAAQSFGAVAAPWELADVIVSGGHKWARAGWGTGFMALSDRAAEALTPVWSGHLGVDADEVAFDEVLPPAGSARAYTFANADPMAEARFAAALEELAMVGIEAVEQRIAERVSAAIDLVDEFAVPIVSSRDERERAGIVVLDPGADRLTALAASLFNHGVTATVRDGAVRLSLHVSTTGETLGMLRDALLSFSTIEQR